MTIRLDGKLVKSLIDQAGGVGKFLEAWSRLSVDGEDEVDRATIFRWCQGQLPKNRQRLMRLAALLDVDPFALICISEGDIATAIDDILEFVQHGRAMPAPIQLAREFFGRRREWPPLVVARELVNRPWEIREIVHDPMLRMNYYAVFELASEEQQDRSRPQVLHFAFRDPNAFAGRWLQYGFVVRNGKQVELRHINGHHQVIALPRADDPVHVETYCGPGPGVFRVASLHRFSLRTLQERDAVEKVLRFPV